MSNDRAERGGGPSPHTPYPSVHPSGVHVKWYGSHSAGGLSDNA